MMRRPPKSPLFPYTALFRSHRARTPTALGRMKKPRRKAGVLVLGTKTQKLTQDRLVYGVRLGAFRDRKSTRLNSSHANISYAVFCLKKKLTTYFHTLFYIPS